jgi:YidC/Oxa1 family membrane protein insertase
MEDTKRLSYAIFLSILAVFIYTQLIAPVPEKQVQQVAQTAPNTSGNLVTQNQNPIVNNVGNVNPVAGVINATAQANSAIPTVEAYNQSPKIRIENQILRAEISLLGGRLTSLILKNHTKELSSNEAVNLVKTRSALYPLGVEVSGISDANVTYNISGMTSGVDLKEGIYLVPNQGTLSFKLLGTLPDGNKIEKVFQFYPNLYNFDLNVKLERPSLDGSPLALEWSEYHGADEAANRYNPLMLERLTAEDSVKRDTLPVVGTPEARSAVKWTGIADNYFAAFIIPKAAGLNSVLIRNGDYLSIKGLGTASSGEFGVFTGAKEFDILQSANLELERSIDLGWFAFIGQPILSCIKIFFNILGNYGLAIVLFTILLKAVLLPLTKTSFNSMRKMQDLQPELQALKERVKDPAQVQQEMMALYKKHGVNPLGGCLPMVLQIPVFLGMYNALRTSIDLRHAPFALWIKDLAAPESLDVLGIHVPVMILLMGASMFVQQMTTPSTTTDPAQKRIMMMMPVVFTVMFVIFPFPAGLVLYWLVNNTISIVQQVALRTERKITPIQATAIAGVAVFAIAYVITLF